MGGGEVENIFMITKYEVKHENLFQQYLKKKSHDGGSISPPPPCADVHDMENHKNR